MGKNCRKVLPYSQMSKPAIKGAWRFNYRDRQCCEYLADGWVGVRAADAQRGLQGGFMTETTKHHQTF